MNQEVNPDESHGRAVEAPERAVAIVPTASQLSHCSLTREESVEVAWRLTALSHIAYR